MTGDPRPIQPDRTLVARVVIPYVAFSVVWIIGGDALLAAIAPSLAVERTVQSLKGITFVALSALLLGVVIFRQLRAREAGAVSQQSSQAITRTLFDNAAVGLALIAPDGRWLRANPKLCEIVGIDREQLLTMTLADTAGDDEVPITLARSRELFQRGEPSVTVESFFTRPDGGRPCLRMTLSTVRDLPADEELFVMILEDVSARHDAEQRLTERSRHLQLAFAAAKLATWDWQPDRNLLMLSPEIERQLGYTPADLEHSFRRWSELIEESQRVAFRRSVNAALVPGKRAQWELQMHHRSGRMVWIQLRVDVQPADGDMPVRMIGSHLDITERKEAELRLRDSERRYRLYFEHSPIPMWTYDKGTLRFTTVNEAALESYGYSRQEFLAMTIEDIRPEEDLAPLRRILRQSTPYDHGVWRHRRRNGELALVEVSSFDLPVTDGHEQRLVLAVEVTEKYRTEHRLRRYSSRLKRLSQRLLSAQEDERRRIALELHDHVGQTLTAAQLDLDALSDDNRADASTPTLARLRESVNTVLEQVRSMTLDLQPPVLKDLGLAAALRWLIKRQSQHSSFTVDLRESIRPEQIPLEISMACFRIVQESLTNATRHSAASNVTISLTEAEGQLRCTIADDGVGFEYQGVLGSEQGWGLGLFGIEERAQLVGGWARIESSPGAGTQIEVRLPLHGEFAPMELEA